MKKFLLWSSAAALSALSFASCSQEDVPDPNAGNDSLIRIKLPDALATRAGDIFGTGTSANKLYVAIYNANEDTTTPLFSNFPGGDATDGLTVTDFDPSTLTATVKADLVKGVKYRLIFWGQSSQATAYTFDPEARTISVDYDQMANFDENRDAFYGAYDFMTTDDERTFTLTRPFAQINVGASDIDAYHRAGGKATTFGMKLTNLKNTLNIDSGEVTSSDSFTGDITVAEAEPAKDYQFPVTDNSLTYMTMAYVLVGDNGVRKDNIDVTLTAGGADWQTYANVPAQWNYRTNIYGSIFTTPEQFDVLINPAWEAPDWNISLPWDGTTVFEPQFYGEDGKTCDIHYPEELAGLAKMVNVGTLPEDAVINLVVDIDLNNQAWTSIGVYNHPFSGTFNGNGHTISNITNSLFAYCTNAVISDIKLENVNITKAAFKGALATYFTSSTANNIETVSGSISGSSYVGGLIGNASGSEVKDCTNNLTVTATGNNCGGVVATAVYNTTTQKGTEINGCINNGKVTGYQYTGGIAGMAGADIKNCTNNAVVTANYSSLGGIAGEIRNWGNVSGCTNNADILNDNPKSGAYGVGGIVGWTRAYSCPSYGVPPTISDNVNNGNTLTGLTGVGGIVGVMGTNGIVTGNKTYATHIVATLQWGSGIVGGVQNNGASYPNVTAQQVTISDNTSTTTLAEIDSPSKNLIVWQNFTCTVENNTVPE